MVRGWVFDPHSGGIKLTDSRKNQVKNRISRLAADIYGDRCSCVKIRFRTQLCYVDAITDSDEGDKVYPLCRLRHFDLERWSISLFTWSNEKYEPTIFPSGEWFGTLEECIHLSGQFLPASIVI